MGLDPGPNSPVPGNESARPKIIHTRMILEGSQANHARICLRDKRNCIGILHGDAEDEDGAGNLFSLTLDRG